MSRESGAYPDGLEFHPDAPWNHVEPEPEWFVFTKVMHVACKAPTVEEADERIAALFDKPDLEIDFDPGVYE